MPFRKTVFDKSSLHKYKVPLYTTFRPVKSTWIVQSFNLFLRSTTPATYGSKPGREYRRWCPRLRPGVRRSARDASFDGCTSGRLPLPCL